MRKIFQTCLLNSNQFTALTRRPTCIGPPLQSHKFSAYSTEAEINLEAPSSHKYCLLHVRKYDRENYLAALFIKDPMVRRAVIALRAFNVELALVRDSTTNSDRAKLRFHFWSKLVEEIIRRNDRFEENVEKLAAYHNYTPVAKELLELFHLIDMDDNIKDWLKGLIGARLSSKVLGYKPFESMDELELYCSKSNSGLYHLAWNMAQQLRQVWYSNYGIIDTLKTVAEPTGKAHGISNIIRGIPYNSTKNCCYVPQDVLNEHKLTTRDFIRKDLDGNHIAPAVRTLAMRCQKLLDDAHNNNKNIPNYFRELFLPRVSIQSHLNKLNKCNYNICDPAVSRRNHLLPLSLWMNSKYFRAPII